MVRQALHRKNQINGRAPFGWKPMFATRTAPRRAPYLIVVQKENPG